MSVTLRLATEADAARLFAWRDDPDTRTASKDQKPLSFKAHIDWLKATLAKTDVHLFVAADHGRGALVGTVRVDEHKGKPPEVSITVDPRQRGRGYAALMIHCLQSYQWPRLVATVRTSNYASLRAFWENGFRVTKYWGAEGFVDLEWRRP